MSFCDDNDLLSRLQSGTLEPSPSSTLRAIHDDIQSSDQLDPLETLPALLPSADPSAQALIALIGTRANAKETLVAAHEALERIAGALSSDDVNNDAHAESEPAPLSLVSQLAALISLCSSAIPRLTLRTGAPSDRIHTLTHELGNALQLAAGEAGADEGREVILAVSAFVCNTIDWAKAVRPQDEDEIRQCQSMLYDLFDDTIASYAGFIQSSLAERTFRSRFPRYARTGDDAQHEDSQRAESIAASATKAAMALSISTETPPPSRPATLTDLLLFAYSPSQPTQANAASLTTFLLPILITSLQTNTLTDESVSLLLSLLSSQAAPMLDPESAPALCTALAWLASAHPRPTTRHATLHALRLALGRCTPSQHLALLCTLLAPPFPPPLRVAAVALTREALCARDGVWASPEAITRLGGIVFRPADEALRGDEGEAEVGWEVQRLVECLSLLYVLLLRDAQNRTGIRDAHTLKSVEGSLLKPVQTFLSTKENGREMGVVALRIGLDRVYEAMESIRDTSDG